MFTAKTEENLPGAMSMAGDERETCSGPIPEVSLWVREARTKPGALGGITAYLFFADAVVTAVGPAGAQRLSRPH